MFENIVTQYYNTKVAFALHVARVATCMLRVACRELRVASCVLRVSSCMLRVAVRVGDCVLCVASYLWVRDCCECFLYKYTHALTLQ